MLFSVFMLTTHFCQMRRPVQCAMIGRIIFISSERPSSSKVRRSMLLMLLLLCIVNNAYLSMRFGNCRLPTCPSSVGRLVAGSCVSLPPSTALVIEGYPALPYTFHIDRIPVVRLDTPARRLVLWEVTWYFEEFSLKVPPLVARNEKWFHSKRVEGLTVSGRMWAEALTCTHDLPPLWLRVAGTRWRLKPPDSNVPWINTWNWVTF